MKTKKQKKGKKMKLERELQLNNAISILRQVKKIIEIAYEVGDNDDNCKKLEDIILTIDSIIKKIKDM